MKLFDCEDFEVIQRAEGTLDFLLITFSSLGMFVAERSLADGVNFWGKPIADKLNYAAIGFVAKKKNWFCSPHMIDACRRVDIIAATYNHVAAYGSSMGGYAALRWGKECGAGIVVAFAPQFTIEPSIISTFDRRYEYLFNPSTHSGMQLDRAAEPERCYIFVDPLCLPDMTHANLISLCFRNSEIIELRHCGHECIRAMSKAESVGEIFRLCISGNAHELKTFAQHTRRTSSIRKIELAFKLAKTKKEVAKRIFAKYGEKFEIKQREEFKARLDSSVS